MWVIFLLFKKHNFKLKKNNNKYTFLLKLIWHYNLFVLVCLSTVTHLFFQIADLLSSQQQWFICKIK